MDKGYTLACHSCGFNITTQVKYFRCPKCGAQIEIQWPDPDFTSKKEPPSISDKEGLK